MKLLRSWLWLACGSIVGWCAAETPTRPQVLDAMKRATAFMTDRVAVNGGYVWSYQPDLSRRWGEMEARPSMIWLQAPGTASMGQAFLAALQATGDDFFYPAAESVAGVLIAGQHTSGGWYYVVDFAGERSLREWYDTIGRNGWRLEEFPEHHRLREVDPRSDGRAAPGWKSGSHRANERLGLQMGQRTGEGQRPGDHPLHPPSTRSRGDDAGDGERPSVHPLRTSQCPPE